MVEKRQMEKRGNLKVVKPGVASTYKILLLKFPHILKFLRNF